MFGNLPENEQPREHFLFVYGTLMEGQRNHHWMLELIEKGYAELISKDAVLKNHAIVDIGGLPAVYGFAPRTIQRLLKVEKPVSIRTNGELYQIALESVNTLDILEGHPHFYNRQHVAVRIPPERKEKHAMVYRGPMPRRGHGIDRGVRIGHMLHTPNRYGLVSEFGVQADRTEVRMTDGGNLFFPILENIA